MSNGSRHVAVLGSHEPDYPRHQVLETALENAGCVLHRRTSRIAFPWRHLVMTWHILSLPKSVRVVYVTQGAHRLVPLLKFWGMFRGLRLLFDPFLSRYNTRVEDRRLYEPGSLQAKVAHWQDWSSCRAADYLIFDTIEHRDYFYDRYNLVAPSSVVPVGVPEDVFAFDRAVDPPVISKFEVLFYGTFIPLQGIETIVRATAFLPKDVRVTVIGKGQTWADVQGAVPEGVIEDERLRFQEPVDFEVLPKLLSEAHVALGIFGETAKAARVVPNKVVQAAAMGRPMVTADTPAIRQYFQPGKDIELVPPNDPKALAESIISLMSDPERRKLIGLGARRVFEKEFSLVAIEKLMNDAVSRLEDTRVT